MHDVRTQILALSFNPFEFISVHDVRMQILALSFNPFEFISVHDVRSGPVCFFHMLLFRHQVTTDSCDPMGYSPPGSSVHGITQARILKCGLLFPPPGDLPHPRIKPVSPVSSPLQADSLPIEPSSSCPVFPTPCIPEDVFSPLYILPPFRWIKGP